MTGGKPDRCSTAIKALRNSSGSLATFAAIRRGAPTHA